MMELVVVSATHVAGAALPIRAPHVSKVRDWLVILDERPNDVRAAKSHPQMSSRLRQRFKIVSAISHRSKPSAAVGGHHSLGQFREEVGVWIDPHLVEDVAR